MKRISCVEIAFKNWHNFFELDAVAAKAQDSLFQNALELAHMRATESIYESAIRRIRETIDAIQKSAKRKIGNILQATSVLAHPFLNPLESMKSLVYAIKHPIRTCQELWKHAKEHPWKCAVIILSNIGIGVFFGAVAKGASLLSNIILPTFKLAVTPSLVNAAVTGARVSKVHEKAELQIACEKANENRIKLQQEAEAIQRARQMRYNEYRRKTCNELERAIKEMEQKEIEFEKERQRQIESLDAPNLEAIELELKKDVNEIERKMTENQQKQRECHQNALQLQNDFEKVSEGKNAATRILNHMKDKNSMDN